MLNKLIIAYFFVIKFSVVVQLQGSNGIRNTADEAVTSSKYTSEALHDEVTSLPRMTSPLKSRQFSGYFDISDHKYSSGASTEPSSSSYRKYIHYYHIESEGNPDEDPVVFWTNGGPGCSGLLGLFTEFGPWRPLRNGSITYNPYSWSRLANLVFIEQPAGVGFSFTTSSTLRKNYNDYRASTDNLQTIKEYFQRFPQRLKNGFHIAAESYGGHYIPQLTLEILNDKADDGLLGQFKGYLVGNPYTSYASGAVGGVKVGWGLQLVPKPEWDKFVAMGCDDLNMNPYHYSDECFEQLDVLDEYFEKLNPYALDYPVCTDSNDVDDQGEEKFQAVGRNSAQARHIRKIHQHFASRRVDSSYVKKSSVSFDAKYEPKIAGKNTLTLLLDSANGFLISISALISSIQNLVKSFQPNNKELKHVCSDKDCAYFEKQGRLELHKDNFENTKVPPGLPYDPCIEDTTHKYLSDLQVQKALHVDLERRKNLVAASSSLVHNVEVALGEEGEEALLW